VDGAASAHSKIIPMASQLTQMMLKPVRVTVVCKVIILYDRLTGLPLCPMREKLPDAEYIAHRFHTATKLTR